MKCCRTCSFFTRTQSRNTHPDALGTCDVDLGDSAWEIVFQILPASYVVERLPMNGGNGTDCPVWMERTAGDVVRPANQASGVQE